MVPVKEGKSILKPLAMSPYRVRIDEDLPAAFRQAVPVQGMVVVLA